MPLGLPQVTIEFKSKAATAIERGSRGIVALILKDNSVAEGVTVYEVNDITEVPAALSATNQDFIEMALIGGVKPPMRVLVAAIDDAAANYNAALDELETRKWDYLAIPGIAAGDTAAIATWIKALRDNKDIKVKAVLPETAGDHEGIINFATNDIKVGANTYSASQYAARIAGLLAGTPLSISATFYPLPEVDNIPRLTRDEYNTAIGAGKFVLYHDGEKVKVARAVNSLVTTTADKGEDFKKIKMVDIMDLRHDDIKKTVQDSYIGKYPNTYDNKMLLLSAVNAYDEGLVKDTLLDSSFENKTTIDVAAQKVYLQSIGVDTSKMTEQQIKEANTRDKVFLISNIKIVDAIEEFKLTSII